jgi:NTP pyrophosphatase (non-canonical NTP hydrolase)
MSPFEYQKAAERTECNQAAASVRMDRAGVDPALGQLRARLLPVRLNHGAFGIAKEAGELLTLVEKWLYYGQPLDPAKFKDELGDVMWYVALCCNALALDLGEVMAANARKLRVRYPERYNDGLAAVRDRAAEQAAVVGNGQWDDPAVEPGDRSGS